MSMISLMENNSMVSLTFGVHNCGGRGGISGDSGTILDAVRNWLIRLINSLTYRYAAALITPE